jgi:GntR family transcriptional regulator
MYEVIYEDLRAQIDSGKLESGGVLPSEPALAEQYGVTRMTVRHAVDRLVNEHMVIRRRGVGTFVTEPRPTYRRVNRLGSLQVEIGQGDVDVTTVVRVQETASPTPDVRRALSLSPRQRAVHILRVRVVDGEPAAVQDSWLPHDVAPGLAGAELVGGSLYRTLGERYGVELDWAEQKVSAVAADGEWAGWLGVEAGTPLIGITRWTYAKGRHLIECATSWTRPDFPLYIRLEA